ncbi:hypothetical protein Tco_0103037 [Tanacetum coccineum]
MTTTSAQQVALDNAMVPLEKRVEIGKCNMRIDPAKTKKEPTYQVVLDALSLTTCYPDFLITGDLYASVLICPRLLNQDFDELPSDDEIVSFIKELGHRRDVKSIIEVVVDHIYQPWRTFKNVDFVELLWEDFTFQIENRDHKKMTNQHIWDSDAYKTYLAYATGAASPKMKRKLKKHASPSKKRTLVTEEEEEHEPAKKEKPTKKPATKRQSSGGADFEIEVLDEPKDKSVDTHKGIGLKPGVLDVSIADSFESETESWGDSGNEANEQEETQDDECVTEEEYERINEEPYGDVNVSLTDAEPTEKEKDNEEMIVAGHVNVNQEDAGNQVKDDAQATQKNEGPIPSSSISSDHAANYLNFGNIPPVDTEVVSILDINVQHEVLHTSPLLTIPVSIIPEHTIANPPKIVTTTSSTTISSLLSSLFPHLQQLTPIPTPTTTEVTTSTTAVSESKTLVALQLRVTDLEKEVKELKDVDNST